MKFALFFALTAALYAAPIPSPDLVVDSQEVVSPAIGAAVIPNGSFQQYLICLNDNPAGGLNDDRDFNDGCATAQFGGGNVLTLTYIGALTSASNYIGVMGQLGWVGPGILEALFTYTPGVETIFTGYVNEGAIAVYQSGSGGALNTPAGDYFYAECTVCPDGGGDDVVTPEPTAFVLVGLGLGGLALRRFRASN